LNSDSHQWITLHRVRFPSKVSALERNFETPTLPECWRFCPSQRLAEDDLPTWNSDVWCGFGIYDNRADAETMVSAPQDHLPFLAEVTEQWHAALIPVMHRGDVNWRGNVESGTAIRPSTEDEAGPLVVVTSAGFLSREPDQIPRIARFARGVQEVMEFFSESEGNVRRETFNGGFDQREGFTVSLWRDDEAMMQTAYWEGTHRTLMDQSRDGSLFDRSSFTRARIVVSNGSWDGDPVLEMS